MPQVLHDQPDHYYCHDAHRLLDQLTDSRKLCVAEAKAAAVDAAVDGSPGKRIGEDEEKIPAAFVAEE